MTDDTTNPDADARVASWTPETDPDGYTEDDIQAKDWFLDTVLNFQHGFNDEHAGGEIGLSVTSNGLLISGLAISRTDWMAGVIEQYREAGVDNLATQVGKVFGMAHDQIIDRAAQRNDAGLPWRARRFLHMKDVRIGTSSNYIAVPFWRGALADVSGWSLGSWSAEI